MLGRTRDHYCPRGALVALQGFSQGQEVQGASACKAEHVSHRVIPPSLFAPVIYRFHSEKSIPENKKMPV